MVPLLVSHALLIVAAKSPSPSPPKLAKYDDDNNLPNYTNVHSRKCIDSSPAPDAVHELIAATNDIDSISVFDVMPLDIWTWKRWIRIED